MEKVLFYNLTAFSQTGGIEKFNKCFMKALVELEEENDIQLCGAVSVYDNTNDPDYYPKNNYKGYSKNKIAFLAGAVLEARKYDVLVLGHINLAVLGVMLKALYPKKKLVLIAHGIDVWGELGGFKKKVLNAVDKIFSVSSYTKKKLEEVHGIASSKIAVFPNTIDPYFELPSDYNVRKDFRERYNVADDEFLLYTLTRLSSNEQYKGYDNVIRSLGEVIKENSKVKYIIAGKYDEAEKKKVDGLIREYGLEDNVKLLGFIKDEELVAHYQMADLYIMPSKNEGFGIVFIEAMVCGVPVVGGNCDGSTDALQNGATGTLVDPESVPMITTSIKDHIIKGNRRDEKYCEDVREKTLDQFSFNSYKERLRTNIKHISAN